MAWVEHIWMFWDKNTCCFTEWMYVCLCICLLIHSFVWCLFASMSVFLYCSVVLKRDWNCDAYRGTILPLFWQVSHKHVQAFMHLCVCLYVCVSIYDVYVETILDQCWQGFFLNWGDNTWELTPQRHGGSTFNYSHIQQGALLLQQPQRRPQPNNIGHWSCLDKVSSQCPVHNGLFLLRSMTCGRNSIPTSESESWRG